MEREVQDQIFVLLDAKQLLRPASERAGFNDRQQGDAHLLSMRQCRT
jgi:hypothetical protein